jgi:quercetin dioxygenase-like cupin family protein
MSEVSRESLDELMACYLAGALPAHEERALLNQLAAGWPEGAAALREQEQGLLALMQSIPAVQPPSALKVEILSMLPARKSVGEVKAHPLAGISFSSHQQSSFLPTPFPGISLRMLHINRPARKFTALMKLEPGARYPSHHHDGEEECLVLEGSLMVGDHRMEAGDYQFCEADSDHVNQWSETGALLYITAPLSLLET